MAFPSKAPQPNMTITSGDSVTIEFTGRLADGTVFDTSRESVAEQSGLAETQPDREYGPLTVEVGAERVIEGLEETLVGLEKGDSRTVRLPPEKAYGTRTEDKVRGYGADEFKELVGDQTPEEGAYLQTENGGLAEIIHVDDEIVRVDFNHELAGETLEFDLEVLGINDE